MIYIFIIGTFSSKRSNANIFPFLYYRIEFMQKHSRKLILYSILLSVISSISLSVMSEQIVFAQTSLYRLRVSTFGGTADEQANGVDVGILVRDTGVIKLHRYYSLPPSDVYFFLQMDSEVNQGSSIRVCAFTHGTTDIINCKTVVDAASNPAEFTTLDLNPQLGGMSTFR